MKVLHVIGDSAYGGGSRMLAALAERARDQGHDVSVLTTCPVFQEDLRRRGVAVVALDCIWRPLRPWRDWHGLLRLTSYLERERYDLVHTHTSKGGFVGRRAAYRAGVPIIVHTVHGFAFHERSLRLPRAGYVHLERRASHWCHAIVTVSRHLREYALGLNIGKPETVVAIPNGIKAAVPIGEEQRLHVRARNNVAPEDFMVLSVGRLAPEKGLESLIDALPIVRGRVRRPMRLLLVGEGPSEALLKRRLQVRGVADLVTLLGFRSDVQDLLAAADLVVLPSIREGMSIALLEAMAARRPIIATRIPANTEATRDGEAARLVPCDDPEELAGAISDLMCDAGGRVTLARQARRIFEEDYTEERMLAGYDELYRTLTRGAQEPTEARARGRGSTREPPHSPEIARAE